MSFSNAEEEERERLIAMLNTYLTALETRDFSSVRLSPNFRHTENTCEIPLGTGFARSFKSWWENRHYFADPGTGQVVVWAAAEENTRQTMVGIRAKVEGDIISEIETLCSRGSGEFFQPEVVVGPHEELHDFVPVEERSSRQQMVEIIHRYFDGIERSNGSIIPATETCKRLVNGGVDANADTTGWEEAKQYRGYSVQRQIDEGYYAYIEALRARRVVVVDEARGLIVVHLLFDHPADPRRPYSPVYFPDPSTVLAFEVFKIRKGLIEFVTAIGAIFPYGIRTGWGDGDVRATRMAV
jgi:hypothetical protein